MANYYLIAVDKDALPRIAASGQNFVSALCRLLSDPEQEPKPFPTLEDEFSKAISNDPVRVPVMIDRDDLVAYGIGKYYDAWAVGVDSKPAIIPPQSIVCIISNTHINDLSALLDSEVAEDIESFVKDPGEFYSANGIVTPVYFNNSDNDFPLYVVKDRPFHAKDGERAIDRMKDGSAWNTVNGYKGPKQTYE